MSYSYLSKVRGHFIGRVTSFRISRLKLETSVVVLVHPLPESKFAFPFSMEETGFHSI